MKPIRIAINGFGRIGRTLFRLLIEHPSIEVVAINDLADLAVMQHLLKYDSIHGRLDMDISRDEQHLIIDDKKYLFFQIPELEKMPWENLDIDFVVEATGKFKTSTELQKHLDAGAKRVILSVPPIDNQIKTVVMGVNHHILRADDSIVSNASCTTNNAAPMIQVIDQLCGVQQAYITTVHSYTSDQSLHDQPHRDLRRARAAAQSIIPTTTGAAKALTKIFPSLAGVIGGCGIRVPVPNGSLTDITFHVKNPSNIEKINHRFQQQAATDLRGILQYTEDPIVSIDIIDSPYSCVFDAGMTSCIDNMVKIIGWYDNESGYSNRIIDLILHLTNI
ncbi:MAG: type I glyceraldehyde-3-phosphate dehydrogenase [Flavobacteriaceae bacterium]|nr:type I glyceraldehyde-3-phosphate dehydrogenase [Flavobacteriaceae bacterium]